MPVADRPTPQAWQAGILSRTVRETDLLKVAAPTGSVDPHSSRMFVVELCNITIQSKVSWLRVRIPSALTRQSDLFPGR